jgi:hypothetical protein
MDCHVKIIFKRGFMFFLTSVRGNWDFGILRLGMLGVWIKDGTCGKGLKLRRMHPLFRESSIALVGRSVWAPIRAGKLVMSPEDWLKQQVAEVKGRKVWMGEVQQECGVR